MSSNPASARKKKKSAAAMKTQFLERSGISGLVEVLAMEDVTRVVIAGPPRTGKSTMMKMSLMHQQESSWAVWVSHENISLLKELQGFAPIGTYLQEAAHQSASSGDATSDSTSRYRLVILDNVESILSVRGSRQILLDFLDAIKKNRAFCLKAVLIVEATSKRHVLLTPACCDALVRPESMGQLTVQQQAIEEILDGALARGGDLTGKELQLLVSLREDALASLQGRLESRSNSTKSCEKNLGAQLESVSFEMSASMIDRGRLFDDRSSSIAATMRILAHVRLLRKNLEARGQELAEGEAGAAALDVGPGNVGKGLGRIDGIDLTAEVVGLDAVVVGQAD
jgi:hypothetical protein